MSFDDLGNRMKKQYEDRTRYFLPRRTYGLIRIDGKAFHSYCKNLNKPFDYGFISSMNQTAIALCKEIQGSKFAYIQSDEISILFTDFETITTDMWFDGNIQKIASVASSIATAHFNNVMKPSIAYFDSRVWTIPDKTEVENYFIWRQMDCVRNSIQSVARSLYSHKELENKNTDALQEMIFQKGQNWNAVSSELKRGRIIIKKNYITDFEEGRTDWVYEPAMDFLKERNLLTNLISIHPGYDNAI